MVLLKVQPARCIEIKYLTIIHRAYNSFEGSASQRYNDAFHTKAAMHPEIPWDKLDMELWLKIIPSDMPIKGTQIDSALTGHSVV